MHNRLISAKNSAHNFSVKFIQSMCVALVASLTKEMVARSIAYHAHGTTNFAGLCARPSLIAGLDCGLDRWTGLLDPTKLPVKAMMHV